MLFTSDELEKVISQLNSLLYEAYLNSLEEIIIRLEEKENLRGQYTNPPYSKEI